MLRHSPSMRSLLRAALAGLLGSSTLACGSVGSEPTALPSAGAGGSRPATPVGGAPSAGGSGGAAGSDAAGSAGSGSNPGSGSCNLSIVASTPTSAFHLLQCSEVAYSTNPPSGGDHYATWVPFQTYDYPVPVGYVVHNLEHGAVAFWYNCPEGCADEVAEVQALIDSQPVDPLCQGFSAERRAVLVPNPDLATRWGVSAWGYALAADCVDTTEFGIFYAAHYGQGPEDFCNDGTPVGEDACP